MTTDFSEQYGVYYGESLLSFTVIRRQRRTLEISVEPNQRIVVVAPLESTEEAIRQKVRKRAAWIVRQQNWFKQFDPRTPERQYLSGETHLYLGKRYRLKVSLADDSSIRLTGGYFAVQCRDTNDSVEVKKILDGWYRKQAKRFFRSVFNERCQALKIEDIPRLQIKQMKTRWGSLSKGGILTLNIALIRAPKECIEYVITHELCHIEHHNHSDAFYKLLVDRLPDWEKRKQKLEESLI